MIGGRRLWSGFAFVLQSKVEMLCYDKSLHCMLFPQSPVPHLAGSSKGQPQSCYGRREPPKETTADLWPIRYRAKENAIPALSV